MHAGMNDAANQQPWRCVECGTAVRRGFNDPCLCTRVFVLNEGDPDECRTTLPGLWAANEGLDDAVRARIAALAIGETYRDGGGGGAEWTMRRIA
jgi:hypothetical protein